MDLIANSNKKLLLTFQGGSLCVYMRPCVPLSSLDIQGHPFYHWDKSNQLQSHHSQQIPTARYLRSCLLSWEVFFFFNSVEEEEGEVHIAYIEYLGATAASLALKKFINLWRHLALAGNDSRRGLFWALSWAQGERKHRSKKESEALQMNSQHKQSTSAQARGWSTIALNKSRWNQQLAK